MEDTYFESSVEAIVLASPEPISARKIAGVIEDITPAKVAEAVAHLNERYAETESSFRIRQIAGGYQYYVLPEYTGFVEELFARRRKLRLTRAALETVAIVAYRQPVTKAEIEHIRGVASDGVLHNLLEKKMVTIVGRAETVGKPLQYGTTDDFLKFFGLNRLEDLPKMSEIEELVKASEGQHQTELILEERADGKVKLNIADGTFDPTSREDEFDDDDISAEQSESDATEPSQPETAQDTGPEHTDSDDNTAAPRLTMKRTGSDEAVDDASEAADETAGRDESASNDDDSVAVDADSSDTEHDR
ncbi:SMC-Scp complex subunit ScpB [candidate division GN15 bacterium]|nr:SMC-Scp complex subunit ScpB [candidate division GN15 bacterium]